MGRVLIGQYDSPFVRRVGVTLQLYGVPFEHRPWSVFGDAARIAEINPVVRVPTLVLEDGTVLTDSALILAFLDAEQGAGASLARPLPALCTQLRLLGLIGGAADKGVALVYERVLRAEKLQSWVDRCLSQVTGALDRLEAAKIAAAARWLLDDDLSHADIFLGTLLSFLKGALPDMIPLDRWPALVRHSDACEALPEFRAAFQPFEVAR